MQQNGGDITKIKLSVNNLLKKSVLIYGQTGSGKTTCVKDILYVLRNMLRMVFVFCPTESNHGTYSDDSDGKIPIVPKQFLYGYPTDETLSMIIEFQKANADLYKEGNNLENLKSLFRKIANDEQLNLFKSMLNKRQEFINKIKSENKSVDDFEKFFKDSLIIFFKKCIEPHIEKLKKRELTTGEKIALAYFHFKLDIAVIFDDITADLKQLKKCKSFLEFIYQGRHMHITPIILTHDSSALSPAIRDNAHLSLFTDRSTAIMYYTVRCKKPKEETQKILKYISMIKDKDVPYTKLIYLTKESKFYLYEADEHNNFRIGSEAIWKFCDKISPKKGISIDSNPFIRKHLVNLTTYKI